MKNFILINKILLLLFWVVFIVNFIQPVHAAVLPIGVFLAAIHLLEFIWQRKALQQAGEPNLQALAQTLLFGILYWRPVLKQENSK